MILIVIFKKNRTGSKIRILILSLVFYYYLFSIEIVQLFTLYRATDIDDLIMNTVGTLIGYFCYQLIHRLVMTKSHAESDWKEPHAMRYMPLGMIVITFVLGFFSWVLLLTDLLTSAHYQKQSSMKNWKKDMRICRLDGQKMRRKLLLTFARIMAYDI